MVTQYQHQASDSCNQCCGYT